MKKIKALVISASLPPFNDSSTIQLVERVSQFEKYGIESTFIGPSFPDGVEDELIQRLPTNSKILRTAPTTYDRTINLIHRFPLGSFLAWIYSNVKYRISAPDVRAGWDRQVVHLCMELWSELKPDIIITSGGSHTAHIAGCFLAKHFSVPWVADMGDPWSLVDSKSWLYAFKAWRNRVIEINTIPYASGLVFTTETTLEAYRAWLGKILPKAIVLPPYGYHLEDFPINDLKDLRPSSQIILSYVGTAHRGNRNLIPIIKVLGTLERTGMLRHRFTFNIVGPHSYFFEQEAKRQGLRSVCFIGRVSYRKSLEWIKKSHVLLVVGNTSPLMIPGKIYLYLGSGRPILYISQLPQEEDPAVRILARFPGVVFVRNDLNSIAEGIYRIDTSYENLLHDAIRRLEMTALYEYESTRISAQFTQFVLTCIS